MKLSKKLTAVILSAFCLAAAIPSVPALADSQKVVTLGADLTEDQKTMILQYFGVYGEENIITLTITNEDEREHLGSYIPLEQIGTRTYSCALVNPTTSGGIQVKTANLTYVTSNMIASTLSTAGVVNCEVLAASPFAVSGTGALTGVLMAYETASGETLDEEKKETATQELVTTTTISDSIGQVEATQIVNETKIQVIEGDVVSTGDIEVIVDTVVEEEEITLSDEDRALLVELLEKIAEQDYNYEEMRETLERVEENLSQLMEEETEEDNSEDGESAGTEAESSEIETTGDSTSDESEDVSDETESSLSEDSILLNTDDSALGSDVIFDATDSAALESTETTAQESEMEAETESITIIDTEAETDDLNDETEVQTEASENSYGFDITVSDSYQDTTSETGAENEASDISTDTEGSADSSADMTESELTSPDDTPAAEAQTEAETEAETSSDEVVEVISLSELVLEPNTDEDATENAEIEAGLNYLTISSARTDLVAGSGTISVYNAEDGALIETVEMSDETKVVSEVITDVERLTELGEDWTEGIEFRIYLENPLEPNMSYYVMIDGEILTTEDGSASVQPLVDSYLISWRFDTLSYGVGLDETVDGIITGETVTGTLYMDAETSRYAVIDSVQIEGVETLATESLLAFTESSIFEMAFGEVGEAVIHVTYYDSVENMNVVNEASYTVTVQAAE